MFTDPSPVITTQPQNYTTFLSLPASLHCTATSSYPITYSWRRVGSSDGVSSEVTGQNTDTLVIPSLLHSDEGWYQCVVAVFGEETVSQSVYLTVKGIYIEYAFVYFVYLLLYSRPACSTELSGHDGCCTE